MGNTNNTDLSTQQYDSTWEDEEDANNNDTIELSRRWHCSANRNAHAARDMQNYRLMCKIIHNDNTVDIDKLHELYIEGKIDVPNLWFYQNKMKWNPDDLYIEEFHEWFGDYKRLEREHSYIQWLFPVQEPGMNSKAHVLNQEEIKLFSEDPLAKERLWLSYRLMLDFYGIEFLDEKTGRVARAKNWKERFHNLNSNTHNNLRITRILKCLGLLGLQHYQAPLVKFFLHETLVEKTLPKVKQSVLDYFIFTVLDKSERRELIRFAIQHIEKEQFGNSFCVFSEYFLK